MNRIDIIGQNGNDGDHYDQQTSKENKMSNRCIFKKPDGVCCEYDKREHKNLTFQNSEYGWDNNGYCMVELGIVDTSDMCKKFELDE